MLEPLSHRDLIAALPRLRRYARVLTGDFDRADDLVQDTLAQAREKCVLGQADGDSRAWLFAIMHDIHADQYARCAPELTEKSPAEGSHVAGREVPMRATRSDRVELPQVLLQIGGLPAEQREVLVLAAVEKLRYQDIARVQGVPIATVLSRLVRARDSLRRLADDAPRRMIK